MRISIAPYKIIILGILGIGLAIPLICQVKLAMKSIPRKRGDNFVPVEAVNFPDEGELKKRAEDLVKKGVEYLKKQPFDIACSHFTTDSEFIDGSIYIFVYDLHGQCFAHGESPEQVWNNYYNYKDRFGTYVIQTIINKVEKNDGWVIYEWKNATKMSYVQQVEKDGKKYIIGAGFYPHSKETAAIALVMNAVALFNKSIQEGQLPAAVFSILSYPLGNFVIGDMYLFASDFEGRNVADTFRPGTIGADEWRLTDDTGKFIIQEMVNQLKDTDLGVGIWMEYPYRNARFRTYLQRVRDLHDNDYIIGCGYYPDIDRKSVIELVSSGHEYMKRIGKTESSSAFSAKVNNEFINGPLFLVVYDKQGNCIANGNNPDIVGQNRMKDQDQDGNLYVKEFITRAEEFPDGTWVDVRLHNAFFYFYIRMVDLGIENYIIACGYTPLSVREVLVLMAKSAVSFFESNDRIASFAAFSATKGNFIRGNVSVMVLDDTGLCYVYGGNSDKTWKNLDTATDDDGAYYIRETINAANTAQFVTQFTLDDYLYTTYSQRVEKDGKQYVIASIIYI